MTKQCRAFIDALRDFNGIDEPNCPVCTGELVEDRGICNDCGEDFEKAARHFSS